MIPQTAWSLPARLTGRLRPLTGALAAGLLLACALAPVASADVERLRVRDVNGVTLARVTWDDEKAVRAGDARGFLVLVERANVTDTLVVSFSVSKLNASALTLVSDPRLDLLGDAPLELAFRVAAAKSAEPRRYPVELSLSVINLNATAPTSMVTTVALSMNVTVSSLPTPLGETAQTLSPGERTAALGAAAFLVLGTATVVWRARRRGED